MKKTVSLLSFFFCLMFISTIFTVNAQSYVEVTMSPLKQSYNRGDVVTIGGELLFDEQAVNGLVGITVVNARGNNIVVRTVSAGTISNTLGAITSAYLSDEISNKLTTAYAGVVTYFTLSVINTDSVPHDLFAVINVYDSNGVPICYSAENRPTVASGHGFTTTLSVVIPSGVACGEAYAYGGLYSGQPNQGGYPLAEEVSIPFTIVGDKQGSNRPSTSKGSPGSYELSFTLPSKVAVGETSVYVRSRVGGLLTSNMLFFTVKQLGDFNGDGILDFDELGFFAENWIAYYKGQPWNKIVDLNKDSKLDFEDIAEFANFWVMYYSEA